MNMIVNGKSYSIEPMPGEMLSDVLRKRLSLTGTKIGCNEAECGTCTVLVDGQSILSCTYPAGKALGRNVITIEGITKGIIDGDGENWAGLHPLQEAFLKFGAVQCGFCIPGQIMTAYGLLLQNPTPTEEEIRIALKDTLCRCGGYPSIERAVKAASEAIRYKREIHLPKLSLSSNPHKVVGTPQIRPDAYPKVTGRAKFTDDLIFQDMLYARVKRAEIPHAILRQLDIDKAKELPGVITVLTADDIPGKRNHGLIISDWPIMVGVGERVRYVGDVLAIVAAETQEIADQAVVLIEPEFKNLPVLANPVQASQPNTPELHKQGNLLKHIKVRKGEMDQGWSDADFILEQTFNTQMTDHVFLEPECSIVHPTSDGSIEVYVGSQIPYADRSQIAQALGFPENRVRIIGQMMGGGFGGKEDIAGQIHASLLSKDTGRPVKLLYSRRESLIAHPKRHATQIRVKVGAKNNGEITAVETELYGDTGAYASLGEKVMTRATTHSSGPYDVPNVRADCYAMYTNNPPAGAFRGFGVTQSAFAIESMVDILADVICIDPIEIRRRNALRVGRVTNTGQVLRESVGLLECIDKVDQAMRECCNGYPFKPRPLKNKPHLIRSWGFAVAYKNTGLGGGAPDKAEAEVELHPDGNVEVRTSSAELGQGLVSVLEMIVAEELSIPLENVNVLLMDTDLTPDGGPTTASRQTYVTGNAVRKATKTLGNAITATLAEHFNQSPDRIRFVEGLAQVGEQGLPIGEVVKMMRVEGKEPIASYEYWAPTTRPLGKGGDMHFAFSFAAQAAEVEVNTHTGEVSVLRVIAANDVGQVINPLGLQGQVEGGVMMGIGNALTENFIVEDGYVFTDRLARYRMPSIVHTPIITSIVVEHPTDDGPYGAKGVGEIVSIPTTPAITNAIFNAVGVRITKLPVDQEYILKKLIENRSVD